MASSASHFKLTKRRLEELKRLEETVKLSKCKIQEPGEEPMEMTRKVSLPIFSPLKITKGAFLIKKSDYEGKSQFPELWKLSNIRVKKYNPVIGPYKSHRYYESSTVFAPFKDEDEALYFVVGVVYLNKVGKTECCLYKRDNVFLTEDPIAELRSYYSKSDMARQFSEVLKENGVHNYEYIDLYGFNDDLLAAMPVPVFAMILVLPFSEQYQKFTKDEDAELKEKGQTVSDNVFFMKQFVRNACGTIALIHSVANNTDQIELEDGPMKFFLQQAKNMDPEERSECLHSFQGIVKINHEVGDVIVPEDSHAESEAVVESNMDIGVENQEEGGNSSNEDSQASPKKENADFAFIAFIHKDGHIYLLDGAREFPVNQGPTTAETFLVDAAKVCKQFIAREAGDMRFNILALTQALA